jgi:hypothetical protein
MFFGGTVDFVSNVTHSSSIAYEKVGYIVFVSIVFSVKSFLP